MKKEMTVMKKVLLSLAAVAAVGVALPAAAQTYGYNDHRGYDRADYGRYDRNDRDDDYRGGGYGWNGGGVRLDQQEAQLASRINGAYRQGQISRYEANRMLRDLQLINGLELQYRRGGLRGGEVAGIENRLQHLAYNLERARRGEHPYGGGYARYGYNDRGYGW